MQSIHSIISLSDTLLSIIFVCSTDNLDEFFVAYSEITFSVIVGRISISRPTRNSYRVLRFISINNNTILIGDQPTFAEKYIATRHSY